MSWNASFRLYSRKPDGGWELWIEAEVWELWGGRMRFRVINGSWIGSIGLDGVMWVERGEDYDEHDLKGGNYRFEYIYEDVANTTFAELDEIPF